MVSLSIALVVIQSLLEILLVSLHCIDLVLQFLKL